MRLLGSTPRWMRFGSFAHWGGLTWGMMGVVRVDKKIGDWSEGWVGRGG